MFVRDGSIGEFCDDQRRQERCVRLHRKFSTKVRTAGIFSPEGKTHALVGVNDCHIIEKQMRTE
jgi:hypothetical protein